jgi:hypothetical protein
MNARCDSRQALAPASSPEAHWAPVRGRALLVGLLLGGLVAAPALAAKTQPKAQPKLRFTLETPIQSFQPVVPDTSRFSFTAPGSPAAARVATVERAFRFTPSGQTDGKSAGKALSLGVSTRLAATTADRSRAAAPQDTVVVPSAYNVDVSVGWKGLALSGGYGHVERPPGAPALGGPLADRVNLGVSYGGKNWRTSLSGSAEQADETSLVPQQRRYSVELGGAYVVAPRFSVTGGLRYRLAPEKPSLLDPNSDDRAVYLGTSLAF